MSDEITPREAALRTTALLFLLLVLISTIGVLRCGPLFGVLGVIVLGMFLWWIILPALAIGGGIAFGIAALRGGGGSRRAWTAVTYALLALVVIAMAASLFASAFAPVSGCEFG